MKHSRILIGLLLILAVVAVGCDDSLSRLNQDETDVVAYLGMKSLFHTMASVENPDFLNEIADQLDAVFVIEDEELLEVTLTWSNFDVGLSLIKLEDDDDNPPGPNDANKLVIVNGTAHAKIETGKIEVQMLLKINGYESGGGVPNGEFTIKITMFNFGIDEEEGNLQLEVTVDGVKANVDMENMR